jgi:hypothetical protein
MATALETFHHALGTVQEGTVLADDHPIVVAVPHLFAVEATEKPAERPQKAAKVKG